MNLQLSNFGFVTSVTVQLLVGFQRYGPFDGCIIIIVVDDIFFATQAERNRQTDSDDRRLSWTDLLLFE